jgi:hypothetical protein
VKAAEKDCPDGRKCCSKPEAAALHPEGARAHYLTIYMREGEVGKRKRRQSDGPANLMTEKRWMNREVSGRQTGER